MVEDERNKEDNTEERVEVEERERERTGLCRCLNGKPKNGSECLPGNGRTTRVTVIGCRVVVSDGKVRWKEGRKEKTVGKGKWGEKCVKGWLGGRVGDSKLCES